MGKQSVHHLIQESIAHFSNPPSAVFYGDGKGGSQDHLQAFVSDFIKQVSRVGSNVGTLFIANLSAVYRHDQDPMP